MSSQERDEYLVYSRQVSGSVGVQMVGKVSGFSGCVLEILRNLGTSPECHMERDSTPEDALFLK